MKILRICIYFLAIQINSPYHLDYPGSGVSFIDYRFRHSSFDGVELTAVQYFSTLINGRGHENYTDNLFPLHQFHVQQDQTCHFHVIHPGAEYVYEIKVDGHRLTIVASDGQELEPFTVDSFIIFPGETFDFLVTANQSSGNYYIRAETLRYGYGLLPLADGFVQGGKAILKYDQAKGDSMVSSNTSCTNITPCLVFNCPFHGYPGHMNKVCITFGDVRAKDAEYQQYGIKDSDVEEIFLNVGFNVGSTINGIRHIEPTAPLSGKSRNLYFVSLPHCVQS